jgi:stage III sporulation protein AF
MELIIDIVRHIMLIVLFASVIEMFLPRSEMGRYVQLILGLFVIITILNPIMNLKDKDFQLKILNISKPKESVVASGIDEGLRLRENNQVLATETAIVHIRNQVTGLINLVPGVEDADVGIVTAPDFIDTGEIIKISIYVQSEFSQKKNSFVEAVDINTSIDEKQSPIELSPQETAQRIKDVISSFYGLEVSKIEVIMK